MCPLLGVDAQSPCFVPSLLLVVGVVRGGYAGYAGSTQDDYNHGQVPLLTIEDYEVSLMFPQTLLVLADIFTFAF